MPDYRNIHTEFWSDPWIQLLPYQDKLLFIYLFSNARSTLAGLYEIGIRQIAFDTGLDEDTILESFTRFTEAGKAYHEDGMVWVPKMPERNAANLRSPKILTNIEHTLRAAKDCNLKRKAIQYFNDKIAPRYGIDTITIPYLQSYQSDHIKSLPYGDAGASDTDNGPMTFSDWQELVQKPPKGSNRTAVLVKMHETLYPGRDPPDFGKMGTMAREVGGAGRMAELLWQNSTRPPTGDVLAYCVAIAKPKGRQKRGTSSDSDRVSIQGHTPTAATTEEFYGDEDG